MIGQSRLEQATDRLYKRLQGRYLRRLWLGAWVVFLAVGPIAVGITTPYLHPTSQQFLGLLGLNEVGLILMMLIGGRIWAARERIFVDWWREGRPAGRAAVVWKAVGALRLNWLFGWPLGVVTVGLPTAIYSLTVLQRGPGTSAVILATWIGAGGYAALLGFFTVDVFVRPVLRDAAARLPEDFAPDRVRLPIASRLFAALLMISGSTGFFLSLGLSIGSGSFGKLALGLGLTAVFTLTTALLCTVMITGSTAGPVADLLAVTRRIRAGELGARVSVSSQDELGLLAASFNDMAAELQRALARIVTSADAERRRVERDLHDGAQQRLVLLRLKLGMLEQDPSRQELIAEIRRDLEDALAELRDLAHGLYPQLLESDGLRGALSDAATRAAIPTSVELDGAGRYPRQLEAAVYFCCLEALQNAAKYAGEGAKATVALRETDGTLKFQVSDNGQGFDCAQSPTGAGLQNMADRIGALGGELHVESGPQAGTVVTGRIPVALAD